MSDRRPSRWVLSSAGKLIRYLHGSYFLFYRNTVSTPQTKYYRTHNQWCCLHWMGHDKSPTVNALSVALQIRFTLYRVQSRLQLLRRNAARHVNCHVWCRKDLYCSADIFLVCFFIRHLYLSVVARLMSVMCADERSLLASWVDTPLTADWLQVCFGTLPDSVSQRYIPHL